MSDLSSIVPVIVALSIASERLVEIIKGFVPWLAVAKVDKLAEARRQRVIQIMAVMSGVVTAALAQTQLPLDILAADASRTERIWTILSLGLLASGGSGLWNSVLTYVLKVKVIKSAEATKEKIDVARYAEAQDVNRQSSIERARA